MIGVETNDRHWQHGIYDDLLVICLFYDTGSGVLLRRPVPQKERGQYHDVLNFHHGSCIDSLGGNRIFSVVRRKYRRRHRHLTERVSKRRGMGTGRVFGSDTGIGFRCVPNDVCDYHTGTAHRLGRRQNEFQSPIFVHYSVVTGCVLSAGAHGMGRGRLLGGNRLG